MSAGNPNADARVTAALRELDELELFVRSWHRASKQGLTEQYLRFAAAITAMKPSVHPQQHADVADNHSSETSQQQQQTGDESSSTAFAAIAAKALNKDAPVFRPVFNPPSTPTGPATVANTNTNTPVAPLSAGGLTVGNNNASTSNAASLRQNSTVSSATNGGFDWESLMGSGADQQQQSGGGAPQGANPTNHHADPLSLHTSAPSSPAAVGGVVNNQQQVRVGSSTNGTSTPGSFTVASANGAAPSTLSRQPSNLIMRSAAGGAATAATTTTVRVGGVAPVAAAAPSSADNNNAGGADYDSFLDDYMMINNNNNRTSSSAAAPAPTASVRVGGPNSHLHSHNHNGGITTTTMSMNSSSSNPHLMTGGNNASSSAVVGGAFGGGVKPINSPSALETSLLNMSGASSTNGCASVTVAGTRSTVAPPSPTVVGGYGAASPSYIAGNNNNNGGNTNNNNNNFTNVTSASQLQAVGATSCQVLVEFKRKRVLQFESKEFVTAGEFVVVGGDRGEDIGVVTHVWPTGSQEPTGAWNGNIGIGKVLRPATLLEISQLQGVQFELEARAVEVAQEKVVEHQLPMRIVDAEYQFDRKKLTFYYQSNHRLDFRNLVRDLYKTFRARIWMEQD